MHQDKVLEIYKMFVETTQHTSDCRQKSNNFYILLNTGIAAYYTQFPASLVIFLGILINIIWFFKIQSYKRLNKAKFQVINVLEKKLPIRVFSDEYKILRSSRHKNLSYYESWIPIIFLLLFLLIYLHIHMDKVINIAYCLFQ